MTLWLPTLLALLAWIPALLGLGALLRLRLPAASETGFTGLAGLAVLAAGALWAGLFAPVSGEVALAACLAGWGALAWRRRWAMERLRADGLTLLAFVFLVSVRHPLLAYDDGLYYLQAVEWIRSNPPIRGLANLHDRFGFNSAWLVVAAALEIPGLRGGSSFFVAGLPVVFAGTAAVGATRAIWRGNRSLGTTLTALLGVPAGLAFGRLGTLSADHVVLIVGAASLVLAALSLESPDERDAARAALALASLAFVAKISTGVVLAGAVVAWLFALRHDSSRWAFVLGLAMPAAIAAPWVARGLLTSGCWLHPVALTCQESLPWSMPASEVRLTAAWVQSWARQPGLHPDVVLGSGRWLGPWSARMAGDPLVRYLGWLLGGGVAAAIVLRRRPGRVAGFIAGVTAVGVIFWWLSAPDPRFGLAYLVPLAMLPTAVALSRPREPAHGPTSASRRTAVALGLLAAVTFVTQPGSYDVVLPPGMPLVSPWPRLPGAQVHVDTNARGFRTYVPDVGDQCWTAPLPCTPTGSRSIRVVDGELRVR